MSALRVVIEMAILCLSKIWLFMGVLVAGISVLIMPSRSKLFSP